ncbi:MAG: SapC family protein [Micavibrio sp.]
MADTNAQASQDNAPLMPLFYTKPTPLDAKTHAKLALKKDFGLDFTKGINAVPVNLIELPQICHSYPIAFAPDATGTPVAILGLRDNENLFLNDQDDWEENVYIPAYIRRYPFIFSEIPGSEQLSLCIDYDDSVLESGGEQRFFNDDGTPTQLSQNALEFCKSYHAAAQQTIAFGKAMAEAGILSDRQAEIAIGGGKKINFSGFRIIDEAKLAEVDDKTFAEWRKKGWLPFIYAHLFSGAQWQRLTRLLNKRMENK